MKIKYCFNRVVIFLVSLSVMRRESALGEQGVTVNTLYYDEGRLSRLIICPPVSNVIPPTFVLVEALHRSHVFGALLERQTRFRWLIGVMDVQEGQRQGQEGRGTPVRLSLPHAPRNNGWTV